jgi:hypothetical protein
MNDDTTRPDDQATEPPAAAGARRRLAWRVATGAAVVAAVSAAVIGLAAADNTAASAPAAQPTTPSPSTSAEDKDRGWPGWWGGGGPWRGGWGGPWGFFGDGDREALHGEAVVTKEGGGTETWVFQQGEVTDVNPSAITIKSEDGVTNTYAVNGDTKVNRGRDDINSVAKGEQAFVAGPKSGDSRTATRIIEK